MGQLLENIVPVLKREKFQRRRWIYGPKLQDWEIYKRCYKKSREMKVPKILKRSDMLHEEMVF